MASVLLRSVCAGVLAATASTGAWGCAPSDDAADRTGDNTVAGLGVGSDPVAPTPLRLPPPRPSVISFVTPAMSRPLAVPRAAATTIVATPPVEAGPQPQQPAKVAAPTDILGLSEHIDGVMVDLDRLVAESLQLQHSLLRLRLRPKEAKPAQPPAEPDPSELPVGL